MKEEVEKERRKEGEEERRRGGKKERRKEGKKERRKEGKKERRKEGKIPSNECNKPTKPNTPTTASILHKFIFNKIFNASINYFQNSLKHLFY